MSQAQFARTIVWLLRVQAALAGLAGLVWFVLAGQTHALWALAGGGIGVLLTAMVALRMATGPSESPQDIVRTFYRAMWLKLAVAAVLFVVVARFFAPWFGPILIGYCATVLAYWIALWRLRNSDG